MKKRVALLCIIILGIVITNNLYAQNIAISDDDGYTADPSAMLDVKAIDKGLLIPRLTTVQRTSISGPATGLLVFDTDIENFFFFDGSIWKMIEAEYIETDPNAWSKLGNAGTVDGTNFIGTTDNVALSFRVNNENSGRIDHLSFNSFYGYLSGTAITTGDKSVGIGYQALKNNTTGFQNVAVGYNALLNNTTGLTNVAVGTSSLGKNTTGIGNTALGYAVMPENIDGGFNTAVGYDALFYNTSGQQNTAIGSWAMHFKTSGNWNTALGNGALQKNTIGNNNTAIGNQAGFNNVSGTGNLFLGHMAGFNETGSDKLYIANSSANPPLIYGDFSTGKVGIGTTTPVYRLDVTEDAQFNGVRVGRGGGTGVANTAVGADALLNSISGYSNTAIGYQTLISNTSGHTNTAVGQQAMFLNNTGHHNCAFGCQALRSNTDGFSNTAFGLQSLWGNTTGNNNTALGRDALLYSTTGNNNVALGQEAGRNIGSGSGNLFIGYQAGYNETGSNKLYIANSSTNPPLIFGDFSTGRVGIGTTSPSMALEVNGSIFSSGSSVSPTTGTGLELLYHTGVDAGILQSYNYSTSTKKPLQIIADPILLLNGNVGIATTNPTSKLTVDGGDINILNIGSGVIMKSPDGNCWRVTVDNTGAFVSTAIACP